MERTSEYPGLPMDRNHGEIRILRLLPGPLDSVIRCQLDVVRLPATSKDTAYEALSYTWGSALVTRRILVRSKSTAAFCDVNITENLCVCLRRLRDLENVRSLWVDSVCINQEDNAERARQLGLMGSIYQCARRVIVWLGDTNESVTFDDCPTRNKAADVLESALQATRPHWWTRAWVVPEFLLNGAEPVFAFSGLEMDYQGLLRLLQEMLADPNRLAMQPTVRPLYHSVARLYSMRIPIQRAGHTSLGDLLFRTSATNATDRRDRVYSLLSLLHPAEADEITPDYSRDVREVFADATYASIIGSGRLDILCLSSLTPREGQSLPTWVVDPTGVQFERNALLSGIMRKGPLHELYDVVRSRTFGWLSKPFSEAPVSRDHPMRLNVPCLHFDIVKDVVPLAWLRGRDNDTDEVVNQIHYASGHNPYESVLTQSENPRVSVLLARRQPCWRLRFKRRTYLSSIKRYGAAGPP